MTVWTQKVELRWRPELHFYERRTDILRALESDNALRAFQWRDRRIGARLGPFEEISVTDSGLTANIQSPTASRAGALNAIRVILSSLEPRATTVDGLRFQCLIPIEQDARLVQEQSARDMFPELVPEVEPVDWAVLTDGRSSKLQSAFQIQFGVVRSDEIAGRLQGEEMSFLQGDRPPKMGVDLKDIPSGALYCSWSWPIESLLGDDPNTVLEDLWQTAATQSEQGSAALLKGRGLKKLADTKEGAGE